jgi:hypothetical protein
MSGAGNQRETMLRAGSHHVFLIALFLHSEDGDDIPSKRLLTFNGVNDIMSQQAAVSITIAAGTSNPTFNVCVPVRMYVQPPSPLREMVARQAWSRRSNKNKAFQDSHTPNQRKSTN